MYVRIHHVDRVKRQLGGEQQVPADPVNLDGFLFASARGEDQWWPVKNAEWYEAWRGRFGEEQQVTIIPTAYPAMATREYFTWWIAACRHCYLSRPDVLDDPRLEDLPEDIPLTASQPRDALRFPGDAPVTRRRRRAFRPDIQRHVRGGRGRGPDGEPQRPVGAMDSEEEEEYARQEDMPGSSGHGSQAQPEQGEVQPDHPEPEPMGAEGDQGQHEGLGDDFFTGAEADFAARFGEWEYAPSGDVDLDLGFLATIPGSQIEAIASRYQGIRYARHTPQVASIRPPPQSTAPNMSWIPPLSPSSGGHVGGFSGVPGQQLTHSEMLVVMCPQRRPSSTYFIQRSFLICLAHAYISGFNCVRAFSQWSAPLSDGLYDAFFKYLLPSVLPNRFMKLFAMCLTQNPWCDAGRTHPLFGSFRAARIALDLSEMIIIPSWGMTCRFRFFRKKDQDSVDSDSTMANAIALCNKGTDTEGFALIRGSMIARKPSSFFFLNTRAIPASEPDQVVSL
ncbi:hypothetical protein PIB30_089034 [Stylosanthes scabra]|uniref:Aminotransferase-like plant mobile domain-containing protein n=1 Tax=Stylosanthes scabra TaxID=79078 RepID=A0ABU6ZSK9_9FABA|nr:hypothetical protein [Stylosanthes scabra]